MVRIVSTHVVETVLMERRAIRQTEVVGPVSMDFKDLNATEVDH